MSTPITPTIAIISIGSMGLGIASLLQSHSYAIITNVSDRSPATQTRAKTANIECVDTDVELVRRADYILSIVPPRDAIVTASRIETAVQHTSKEIWYLDLNAISPATARRIDQNFNTNVPSVRFVDGGIIGGPPSKSSSSSSDDNEWKKPGIPISGPRRLPHPELEAILNMQYISPTIGSASGLKCCFAALSKGFTALALQSYTTAARLDVLPHLQSYLEEYSPGARAKAEKGIVGCTSKAYRWVEEMNQIGETFAGEGAWKDSASVFREIAGVFEGLAEVVESGEIESANGAEGVVKVLGEGLKK